jgi:hypothetical protein
MLTLATRVGEAFAIARVVDWCIIDGGNDVAALDARFRGWTFFLRLRHKRAGRSSKRSN